MNHEKDHPYNKAFFADIQDTSKNSAEVIVPWVLDLIQPKSVIDVGCGAGSWLAVFHNHGVEDFLGLDGDWVSLDQLQIPASRFQAWDLQKTYKAGRKFDLVVTFEVAEHLPAAVAGNYVESLTELGPVVLFSAAVPQQGGIRHLNEQWPAFWINLFEKQNYAVVDCLRGRFWNHRQVAPWYVQNSFFFVQKDRLSGYPRLLQANEKYSMGSHPLIHPVQYFRKIEELTDPRTYSLQSLVKVFPYLLWRSFTYRLGRIRSGTSDK